MNRAEAKVKLEEGYTLTHRFFGENEYVKKMIGETDKLIFEDGNICTTHEFWLYRDSPSFDKDWSIKDSNLPESKDKLDKAIEKFIVDCRSFAEENKGIDNFP